MPRAVDRVHTVCIITKKLVHYNRHRVIRVERFLCWLQSWPLKTIPCKNQLNTADRGVPWVTSVSLQGGSLAISILLYLLLYSKADRPVPKSTTQLYNICIYLCVCVPLQWSGKTHSSFQRQVFIYFLMTSGLFEKKTYF